MLLTSLLNALPGAVTQGLIWGLMAIGVYITYRILDVADLTVDGSLALGGAACVMLIRGGANPWLALPPCAARRQALSPERSIPAAASPLFWPVF